MKYKAALFDMDGTILDTLDDLHNALNVSLESFGYPKVTRNQTRDYVGNGAARLIKLALPENTDEESFERVLAYFKQYYSTHCRINTVPYERIIEILLELKRRGVALAVVSNKAKPAVETLAAEIFPGIFDTAIGESGEMQRKPAPDMVFAAAEALGAEKDECVYIGDSEVDVMTAANAGMDCISVCWGFRDRAVLEQAGARVIVEKVSDLINYIV